MLVEASLLRSKELRVWIHEQTNELILPNSERIRIGAAALHLAQEHHDAIITLIDKLLYGSAFALIRVQLEAYAHGLWLLNFATDTELQNFMKGTCPKLEQMIKKIGNAPETGGAWLKVNKETNSPQFNQLTHGGASQVIRRITEVGIESSYPDDELARLLDFSVEIEIRVAAELFALADMETLLAELEKQATVFRNSHKLNP